MVLLDKGRFPKVFGWKDACNAYIEHIRICKRNMIQYDLDKALARENIVEGLLLAIANIDDIVAIIKGSDNPSDAAAALIAKYGFNKEQVDAILAMKLSSLCRLDGVKLNNELEEIKRFIADCRYLLSEPTALDEKLIEILDLVANKFGTARRTKIEDTLGEDDEPEPIVEKDIVVIRSGSNIKIQETTKKTSKADVIYTTNLGSLILITNAGKFYTASLAKLAFDKDYKVNEIFDCGNEKPLLLEDVAKFNAYGAFTCVTANGFIKKSRTNEYLTRSKKGSAAIKLDDGDKLIAAWLTSDDSIKVVIKSTTHYNCYPLSEISYTGKTTKGVKAIKLADGEKVKEAFITDDATYTVTSRAVKGVKYG